jgi:hypothetical protein
MRSSTDRDEEEPVLQLAFGSDPSPSLLAALEGSFVEELGARVSLDLAGSEPVATFAEVAAAD